MSNTDKDSMKMAEQEPGWDYKSLCIDPWLFDLWFANENGSLNDIFDVELAIVLGVHESIVLHKLFNIQMRLHYDKVVTPYDTMTAPRKQWIKNYFPYLTKRQFEKAIFNLKDALIISVNKGDENEGAMLDPLTISLDGLVPFLEGIARYKKPRIEDDQEQEDWSEQFDRPDDNPISTSYWKLKDTITEEAVAQLQNMRYVDFLKSDYWTTVRKYVLYDRGAKCFLCPTTSNLHVHHKTYEHRGCEIHHLDDLVILCSNCHARHHGKLG